MAMDGLHAVKAATGEYPVYPGHPLTVAWQIMAVFHTPDEALRICKQHELNCPEAVADNRISGGGGEVYRGCDLLRKARDGASADELIAWADASWTDGQAGGHTNAVRPGLAQAEKLKEQFPEKLAEWLARGSADAAQCEKP